MGMANPVQIAKGIHFRQYSRAFIIADSNNTRNRIVFVNIDACMGTQIMKTRLGVRNAKLQLGLICGVALIYIVVT